VLDDTVAHVVLMVAREAVSDAVRHAQPQTVRVSVDFAAVSVRWRVVDDGSGFVPVRPLSTVERSMSLKA
jgi:signal transduction histidine kinase